MNTNLGTALAKIHMIADKESFKASREPIDLVQLSIKPLGLIKQYLVHRIDDYTFLCDAAEVLSNYVLENFNNEKPYFGFCHGDIHSGNVFFQDNEPKIFDFDCMGYGWRAYEICVFLWNEMRKDEKYIEGDAWKGFLRGYNSVRQLIDIELASIFDFSALRQLWMMGIHADVMERNAGCCWYNDEYFDSEISTLRCSMNELLINLNTKK